MQKLTAVEEAKALMNEAKEWGVWRWLLEKGRVRVAADRAVEALEETAKRVKASWDDDLKKAYREFEAQTAFENNPRVRRQYEKAKEDAKDVDPEVRRAVERVKKADDEAENARVEAERTFDEAERHMSAGMARQGAEKAIASWDLREKAIRKAESVTRRKHQLSGER